ncbi:hypothetical protein [Fluviicola sp.]|jgi:hypothetical protein|uniref:hypothetical protein n=1 Tax=Fluviicola sp. TaxID=1917219 RepID=UPI00282C096F|nr:hypothetical protein [Fluviicola sp.]MDR0802744.1 hypothetical protein [Fluviicola sp.]
MKNLLLILVICVSSTAFSQKKKVTIEGDTIRVDGVSYAILEKKGVGAPVYTIKSMNGTALMNWQFLDFNNPNKVSNSNPHGRVIYFQVTFFNDKQQCEINPAMATAKGVAKCIVENELIKEGEIDQEAENNFVLVHGKKFSEEKQTLRGGSTIIINNR